MYGLVPRLLVFLPSASQKQRETGLSVHVIKYFSPTTHLCMIRTCRTKRCTAHRIENSDSSTASSRVFVFPVHEVRCFILV